MLRQVMKGGAAAALLFLFAACSSGGGASTNAPCVANSDCASKVCHGGICAAQDQKDTGERCTGDGECKSFNCKTPLCAAGDRSNGERCLSYLECASGNCLNGRCGLGGGADAGPDSGALAAPADIKATGGDRQVTVSWTPATGAAAYNLYWKTTPGVTVAVGTKVLGVKSPYIHTGLTNGKPYYYIVTAVTGSAESSPSGEATATPHAGTAADAGVPQDKGFKADQGATTGHGSVASSLSGGAYGLISLTNTRTGGGKVEVYVFTADPKVSGKAILGLTVVAPSGGAVSGQLTADSKTGAYTGLTSKPLLPGTYAFTVSGARSGTVSAKVLVMPTCTVTMPSAGSTHKAGTNLTIKWLSTGSQRATYLLTDNKGTVQPQQAMQPDPHGVIIAGKDIPYASPLDIKITTAWSAKAVPNTAGVVCAAEGGAKVTLY